MYHLYHHQLQIALFNGFYSLFFLLCCCCCCCCSIFTHVHCFTGLLAYCFVGSESTRKRNKSKNNNTQICEGNIWERNTQRNRPSCLFENYIFEYRWTGPYQRNATIFHDKRRTNEWNINWKNTFLQFSVVFFSQQRSIQHCCAVWCGCGV